MAQVIIVAPIEGGWLVQRGTNEPWMFESGAQAEWSARKLGEAIAESGEAAEILVCLKDGELAGRLVCPPAQPLVVSTLEREREPA